jgi:hypothetical protein
MDLLVSGAVSATVIMGCTPAPPLPPPIPAATIIEFDVTTREPGLHGGEPARSHDESGVDHSDGLDQPALTKLRLGHYRNEQRGLGLVVDLTELPRTVASPGIAKVRFDGETEIRRALAAPGPAGRTDYLRDGGRVLLHVWSDGRVAVYVPGAGTTAIDVMRDADALPLPSNVQPSKEPE